MSEAVDVKSWTSLCGYFATHHPSSSDEKKLNVSNSVPYANNRSLPVMINGERRQNKENSVCPCPVPEFGLSQSCPGISL